MADGIGFDVASGIGEVEWSQLAPFIGNRLPIVSQVSANRVVAGAAAMTVDVGTGIASAFGVRTNLPSIVNLSIAPVVTSGASRWDAVVLRYDWSTNTVTPVVVQGTASVNAPEVLPGGLNVTSGVKYDQVLALVRAVNGSNALTISDKRLFGAPYYTAPNVGALPAAAPYGTTAYVLSNKTTYRSLMVSGSLSWVADSSGIVEVTGDSVFKPNTDGWSLDSASAARSLMTGPYDRQIDLQVRNFAGSIGVSSVGNFPDTTLGWLQGVQIPDMQTPINITYLNGGTDCAGLGRITPDGAVWLLAGQAGNNLSGNSIVRISLRFSTRKAAF